MLDSVLGYFGYRNMSRSPTSFHPLSNDSRVDDTRRILEVPKKETTNLTKPPLEQPPEQAATNIRARDPIRSRRSTPTPSTSASQVAVKRTESNRQFESPERRTEPARKRRYTDEDQLRATVAEKAKENSELSQLLYSTRTSLAEAIKKNNVSQQKIQDVLGEKSAILTELQSAKKDWDAKEQEMARKVRELEAVNKKKDEDLRIMQAKLRATEEKQLQMAQLLEVRTADLNGVQTFLTTADMYSGAEVIAMTESLNAEIFQTAAYMAELLEDESMMATPQERGKNVEKYRATMERFVRREIGEGLWLHLQKHQSNMRTDPLPLQLAFQCYLSKWCAYNIRYFTLGNSGDFLEKLYQRIRESEAQPIAGRWRSITSAKIASFKEAMPANVVIDGLLSLLYFCGWSAANEQSKRSLLSVQQMIFTIEKITTQLKAATKEGITTVDMEVFVVPNDSTFTRDMDDVYAENVGDHKATSNNASKRVLCTVGLGLRRSILKRSDGGKLEHWGEVLLKPKVSLVSALMDNSESGIKNSPPSQGDRK